MRRKTGLLMDGDQPEGGRWNFDSENRKPAGEAPSSCRSPRPSEPDKTTTSEVLALVGARIRRITSATWSPSGSPLPPGRPSAPWITFVEQRAARLRRLPGRHAAGREVSSIIRCSRPTSTPGCSTRWRSAAGSRPNTALGRVPLNAAEGFIRQIIGWREYVRGIYWLKMPDYVEMNALDQRRPLPDFYWSGETEMACLKAAIGQTRDEAYAHHIQRLMVTGNFAMLAGVDPKAVHEWYLAVYADAYEWVELPNTLGMSLFADGGLLASKPYAASGNYINKMSDYCRNCHYDVKQKTGEKACPFNPLYWDFLARNEAKLRGNPRLAQVYRTWDRMDAEKQAAYRQSAAAFLSTLDR